MPTSGYQSALNERIGNNALLRAPLGVELFRVLITRNLLILGTATTAKKAPLPNPLYVYCTKMLWAPESNTQHVAATVSHRFSEMNRKSAQLPAIPQVTTFPILRYTGLAVRLLLATRRHAANL